MADTCALEGIDITKSFGGFSALKDVGTPRGKRKFALVNQTRA